MIAVAIVTLIALAVSTNQRPADTESQEIIAGLNANLQALTRITGFPRANVRSVIIVRGNREELTLIRETPAETDFKFLNNAPADLTPFSAILFANASFLNALASADDFAVTGVAADRRIGAIRYTSFDGLVLELIVSRTQDATWLRMVASHSVKLANRYRGAGSNLLQNDQVIEFARRLNGRVYMTPDQYR